MPVIPSLESTCDICENFYFRVDVTNPEERVPHVISCGHIFCKQCITKHLLESPNHSCPTCRKSIARVDDAEELDAVRRDRRATNAVKIPKKIKRLYMEPPERAYHVKQEMQEILIQLALTMASPVEFQQLHHAEFEAASEAARDWELKYVNTAFRDDAFKVRNVRISLEVYRETYRRLDQEQFSATTSSSDSLITDATPSLDTEVSFISSTNATIHDSDALVHPTPHRTVRIATSRSSSMDSEYAASSDLRRQSIPEEDENGSLEASLSSFFPTLSRRRSAGSSVSRHLAPSRASIASWNSRASTDASWHSDIGSGLRGFDDTASDWEVGVNESQGTDVVDDGHPELFTTTSVGAEDETGGRSLTASPRSWASESELEHEQLRSSVMEPLPTAHSYP